LKYIDINLSDKYNIDSRVLFDFAYSLFHVNYFKVNNQKSGEDAFEEVNTELAIESINDNNYE
jgi:long-subunit fatty acid transport protein